MQLKTTQSFKMKPYEVFKIVFYEWINTCGIILGINILGENFKVSFHTINTVVGICSISVFSLYTAFTFEFEVALKSLTVLSLACQVS